ncbi:MAG: PIN domain-containing protein [Verrucomicrobia bacterium]|nr:PIN domain-containing protein [Verrucomicrobiota bacterium]
MRFLLDTNVLSEAGKKRPHPKVLNWLQAHESASAVPAVALAERYQGAHNAPKEKRARLLAELDALVMEAPHRILPFDERAARVWGEYVSRPALKLRPRSYPDTQIAAIALSHGLTVVTRNTKDFPEVPVINPFGD